MGTSAAAFKPDDVSRLGGWRAALGLESSRVLAAYLNSLRIKNKQDVQEFCAAYREPCLFLTYHSRSLLAPWFLPLLSPSRPLNCLISPSKLAAWEVAFFEHMGLRVIRGSSSRRGVHATRELVAALRRGENVALSPDGPKGPPAVFTRGAAMIARVADVPVVMTAPVAALMPRLPTWDRQCVPFPGQAMRLSLVMRPRFSESPWANDAEMAEEWSTEFLAATKEAGNLRGR